MNVSLGKYRHYKGKLYEVVGTVIHSETLEELILYKTLYKPADFPQETLWVRPKTMFLEHVTVDGSSVPRFQFIG